MRIFASSDFHLYHRKMLEGEIGIRTGLYMEKIIERHVATISDEDEWYFLGDLLFQFNKYSIDAANLMKGIPGRKIMVRGNHDARFPDEYFLEECGFQEIHDLCLARYGVLFSHYPISGKMNRKDIRYYRQRDQILQALVLTNSTLNIHGHLHEYVMEDSRCINVSVEQTNYYPRDITNLLSLDEQ